jgi:hypothetical protein
MTLSGRYLRTRFGVGDYPYSFSRPPPTCAARFLLTLKNGRRLGPTSTVSPKNSEFEED